MWKTHLLSFTFSVYHKQENPARKIVRQGFQGCAGFRLYFSGLLAILPPLRG